ncbi:response regulator [Roseomonas sp. KE2513]|nr:response regulator [Roseomonas sp. KE2513]
MRADFDRLAHEGGSTEIEYRVAPPGGPARWLLSRAELQPGEGGGPGTIVGVTLDVTGGRLAEERLRESEARLRALAGTLEERGYHVLQAGSGPAALALLEGGEAVDLLVSDFSMPGMDGVALIREAQRRRPRLPAILLTGYAGDAATLPADGAPQLADRAAALLKAARRG